MILIGFKREYVIRRAIKQDLLFIILDPLQERAAVLHNHPHQVIRTGPSR